MADTMVGNASTNIVLGENLTVDLIDIVRPITFSELPEIVQRRAKHSLIDTVGVAALGSNAAAVEMLKRVLLSPGGSGDAMVFGTGHARSIAVNAAMINGLASHILDLDDAGSGGHVSGNIVPTALAIGELVDASGVEILAAMVAGYETAYRINKLVTSAHYYLGFHTSGTVGTFGSAAAGCHLLKLDRDQWAKAFGIAGSLASGLLANFGTMTKPLHSGNAARNGVTAALLAREGFTGTTEMLEATAGFVRTHTSEANAADLLRPLGSPYGLEDMIYKFNAACSGTHSAADGIRRLMRENGITAEDVDHVDLRVPKVQTEVANIQWPKTVEAGKFSNRFLAAAAVLGINTAESFPEDDAQIADPKVQEMIGRIEVSAIPNVFHGGAAEIEMFLTNGKVLEISLNSIEPFDDLDEEANAVTAKFERTASRLFSQAATSAAVPRLLNFEGEPSVRRFLADLDESAHA